MTYLNEIIEGSLDTYEKVKEHFEARYSLVFKEDIDFPNLYLVTFDEKTDLESSISKDVIGTIFVKNTNEMVCSNYSLTYDAPGSTGINPYKEEIDFSNVKYYQYNDGTLVRRFFYDGKWNIATSKCISAYKSHWLSITFGDMFDQTVKAMDYQFINEDKEGTTYFYLLQHPQNRIVKKYNKPNLVYLGSMENNILTEAEELELKLEFKSLDEVYNYINKLPYDSQSLIITNGKYRIKVLGDGYKTVKNIRGNANSISKRYIELINNEDEKELLKEYYKEYSPLFVNIETDILNLAKRIKAEYINRYIYHNTAPSRYYHEKFDRTLKQLHAEYLRTKEKTTLDKVYNKIKTLPTHVIYWLLGY